MKNLIFGNYNLDTELAVASKVKGNTQESVTKAQNDGILTMQTAIKNYLLSIRESWAKPIVNGGIEYASNVFIAQIIAAILNVTGVINATNVTVNGNTADIALTQTSTTQEVPVMGTVSLNVGA